MTTLNENNLNDQDENLRNNPQDDDAHTDQLGENTGSSAMEANEYEKKTTGVDSNSFKNSDLTPGPGDEDDDDDDTLIPIEDDDDDDLLNDDDDDDFLNEDDDVVPGTDMDADDLDDDDDDEDSGVDRNKMGDMGSNVTGHNEGRTTGRMIDHEPGTGGI